VSEYPFDPELDQTPRSGRRLNLIEGNTVNHRPRAAQALKGLNRDQKVAVSTSERQVLVLAGAGCGKTRVLAHRAAFLIEALNVRPEKILAVTLTNKAAREMKGRIRPLCGADAERINAGTFHAMCARVLRSHHKLVGRTTQFSIYDEEDGKRAIRRMMSKAEEAFITPLAVLREISVNKNHEVPLDRYESLALDQTSRIVSRVWREYELELRRADALDFDDLLLRTVQLLKGNADLRAAYQRKWPNVLVDEYQDTNPTQARLLRLLAGRADPRRSLMVVGDDKQVIFGFRLADVRVILGFEEEYPGATVVTLRRNYRNTPQILKAANALIAHNELQRPMSLEADKKTKHGPEPRAHSATTDTEEARWIALQIQRAIEQGIPERDIAVLARWGAIVNRVEHALAAAGISYRVMGSGGFFKSKEIRVALAHLRLLVNSHDEAAFATALGIRPKVGTGTIAKIIVYANRNALTLIEAATAVDLVAGVPSTQARENVRSCAYDLLAFTGQVKERSVSALAHDVIRMPLGVADSLAASEESEESERRFGRLDALVEAARTYERQTEDPTLAGWLHDVLLAGRDDLSGPGNKRGRVTIGTIHAVKGLEWPIVIGAGLEGRVIPSYWANTKEAVEEERRMAYVLLTRAARILVLSYALSREGRHSGPSRFISEALATTSQEQAQPRAAQQLASAA
jgi:DNA helicase-2/ATP-dependent DNA helicase PcrA